MHVIILYMAVNNTTYSYYPQESRSIYKYYSVFLSVLSANITVYSRAFYLQILQCIQELFLYKYYSVLRSVSSTNITVYYGAFIYKYQSVFGSVLSTNITLDCTILRSVLSSNITLHSGAFYLLQLPPPPPKKYRRWSLA